METRDFKGIWIPKEIWEDKRLSANQKIILMEIDSLDATEEHCYASNEHLAEICQCGERKVSEAISKLVELGFIEVVSFNGRTRVVRSRLAENARQTSTKCEADTQKVRGVIEINSIDNKNRIKESTKEKPTLEEVKAYCKERNNGVDAERWFNYYSANGWKVGKNPMKDWKAAVRTWERNGVGANTKLPTAPESSFDLEEFFERNRKRS